MENVNRVSGVAQAAYHNAVLAVETAARMICTNIDQETGDPCAMCVAGVIGSIAGEYQFGEEHFQKMRRQYEYLMSQS